MLNHFAFLIFPSSYNLIILLHLIFTLDNTSEFSLTVMARIGTYVGFTLFIFSFRLGNHFERLQIAPFSFDDAIE